MPQFLTTTDADFEDRFTTLLGMKREDSPDVDGIVAEIIAESPAAQGGLQPGDVITSFNGHVIQDMHELPRVVATTEVGQEVEVDVVRQGKSKTLSVTIAALRDDESDLQAAASPPPAQTTDRFGLEVEALTPDAAQRLGLSAREGVLVANIDPDGPAAQMGIRRGDVIREVNRRVVQNTEEYAAAVENRADDTILLLVSRDDNTLYIYVALHDNPR